MKLTLTLLIILCLTITLSAQQPATEPIAGTIPADQLRSGYQMLIDRLDHTKNLQTNLDDSTVCTLYGRYYVSLALVEQTEANPSLVREIGTSQTILEVLHLAISEALAINLYNRATQGSPMATGCVAGDWGANLDETYLVVENLWNLMEREPELESVVSKAVLEDTWRSSVIANSGKLRDRCLEETHPLQRVSLRVGSFACNSLARALETGISPQELGLDEQAVKSLLK